MLVAGDNIFIQNFLPGVFDRMDLGFRDLALS